jgi:hypothetical protein
VSLLSSGSLWARDAGTWSSGRLDPAGTARAASSTRNPVRWRSSEGHAPDNRTVQYHSPQRSECKKSRAPRACADSGPISVVLEHPVRRARFRPGSHLRRVGHFHSEASSRDQTPLLPSGSGVTGDRHIRNDRTPNLRCAMGIDPERDRRTGCPSTQSHHTWLATHRSPA